MQTVTVLDATEPYPEVFKCLMIKMLALSGVPGIMCVEKERDRNGPTQAQTYAQTARSGRRHGGKGSPEEKQLGNEDQVNRNANEMPKIFTASPPSLGPLSACPSSFPSRFVIGRSRGEAVAERRREELNGYIWHLIHAAPEVAEVSEWLGEEGM